jgi:aspartate oxidase
LRVWYYRLSVYFGRRSCACAHGPGERLDIEQTNADIVVVGGGSAGATAAIHARRRAPEARVVMLEKAHVKRSGAIAIGMDGLNNAIIPGHATAEQYVREITLANDGIVNQRALLAYATRSFSMVQELEGWGVKFQKTESGEYDVKKVHHNGAYVLPMPEGDDLKRILTREIKRAGVRVLNRIMATKLLVADGQVCGVMGVDVRAGRIHIVRSKSVVLCAGASGRLGLPASGYLFGTYENPANAGDGYAMALPRRRRAHGHRVLSDQPAYQGLQRPCLRLCDGTAWRTYRQRPGPSLHPERLLERTDDAGVLSGAPLGEWTCISQAESPRA